MIPKLYNNTYTTLLGELNDLLECKVTEERNGQFELELIYVAGYQFADDLVKENIIVAHANDTLLNQKFRIYNVKKITKKRIKVLARHISFDLRYDFIKNIDITNQSCEYALNTIFINSQFSQHFRGYSDIVNAQNYSVSKVNCLRAISGVKGSIIDTYGTGAEILRDNTDIYVLNARGHDNGVTIEYKKNLTGFELEEDTTDLETRVGGFAKYTNEAGEEIIVESDWIDSPLINNYVHPYISPDGPRDYSPKFKDDEIPTKEKLNNLCRKEFTDNKRDITKQNFKIEFIPLSKCVGYEGLEDRISLCDKVTIKHSVYGTNTQAKAIKTVYNVLNERYESMELGEPKTTLNDIIGDNDKPQQGSPGKPGPPGADGNIGDFPDSLPLVPVLTANVYGFASIELNWTFESKVYYTYELYASKTKDFIPNSFDLICEGQVSSFLFQAQPGETWYFRCCGKNSYRNRTAFSEEVKSVTTKIDDLANYVDTAAIGDVLIGTLSFERGWAGTLAANYIDARNLSVTDGNGLRTLDIDSYGNVNLNVASLKIIGRNVATEDSVTAIGDKQIDLDNANKENAAQIEDLKNNGVSKVKNSIIDVGNHGIKVGREGSEYGSLQDETGNYMYSYGKEIARYNKDGGEAEYMKVRRLQAGHLRFELYEDRQEIHYIDNLDIGGIVTPTTLMRRTNIYEGWEVD